MTSDGPRHGMTKVVLPDFDTATKLIAHIGEEVFALAGRLRAAREVIAQGEAAVKQAHRDFHKLKQEHIDQVALPPATNNRE